jgi:hypothetical protein
MNSQQAKTILEVWRPGGQDAGRPEFTEALRQVERDPDLARWFAEQQSFDSAMRGAVQGIPVPPALKASLVATRRLVQVPLWQQPRARLALAASVLLLGLLAALLITRSAPSFADCRRELVHEAWDGSPHVELASSDLGEIRRWLKQHHVSADFMVPTELKSLPIAGARIVEWRGRTAAMVCFAGGLRHMHLFVLDRIGFPDAPQQEAPDFDGRGIWKTASWSQDGKTYVLSGMNSLTFVRTFRKSGQWTMDN